MMFIFTKPEYLVLLFVIPIIIFIHLISVRSIKKRAVVFANFDAIKRVKGVETLSKNMTILYLNIVIASLIVFSVSGVSITKLAESSEMAFVIAIDASKSMSADDIQPNRFEAAKKAAINFLGNVPEKTRIGIVSFSGSSFIEQEMTDDKSKIKRTLENMKIKEVGGTDFIDALSTSVNLLRDEDERTIILISDGQVNVNLLQEIIDYSNKNKAVIYALGIGTKEGSADETGAVYKISEDTMRIIAEKTEGKYYSINDLGSFYSSLSDIIKVTKKKAIYDISLYLMIAALILLLVNFILVSMKYRGIP